MTDSIRPENERGRIEISVPKAYTESDDSVWEDLETYLFQGFLTSHAIINSQFFVFKTLNHLELRMIDFMRPYTHTGIEQRNHFRAAFIAYSIFMVNGNNMLVDRDKNIIKLHKIISKLNNLHQEKIFENLKALNERASRVFPLAEVYSFEDKSRFKWHQVNGSPLNSVINTGIPGTDSLGLCHLQSLWCALNRIQDKRDETEKDWSHAKFIGGCFAGKGMRSIEDKDKARHEREKRDREERKFKVLRQYLNRTGNKIEGPKETVMLPDGRLAEVVKRHRAESAEELAKQLSAALNGEKDAHDLAIEEYYRQAQDRQKEIEKERRQLIFDTNRVIDSRSGSSVLSKDEAQARINRLKEAMLSQEVKMTPDLNDSNSDTT